MTAELEGGKRNFLMGNLAFDEGAFAVALPNQYPPGSIIIHF